MKEHFLLAEDDENLGTLLTTFLNSKGFQTKWVKNGEEAIAIALSFIVLILLPKLRSVTALPSTAYVLLPSKSPTAILLPMSRLKPWGELVLAIDN